MRYCRLNCVAVVLVCLAVGTAEGQSLGRWRLPSTPAQFFGYGYGPGHHAPMVRMPGCTPMSVQRLEVVRTPNCQGACGVGCAGQPYGCGVAASLPCHGGNGMAQPVQSCPCNASQDLFYAPAKPIVPMAPQPDTALPAPAAEPLLIPQN